MIASLDCNEDERRCVLVGWRVAHVLSRLLLVEDAHCAARGARDQRMKQAAACITFPTPKPRTKDHTLSSIDLLCALDLVCM